MFGHVFLPLVASVTLAARHLPLPHLYPSPLHPALPVVSNRFIPRGLACRRGRKASRFLVAQPLLRCLLVPDTRWERTLSPPFRNSWLYI
jgi:hypothetical protein